MTQTNAPSEALGSKMVLPFINAVRDVFQMMAGVKTTIGKPYLKTDPTANYEVCGIIGFTGQITGSVVVSFSDAAAEKLVHAFSGSHLLRTDPDFADAIGELANMIAGNAKQHLGGLASISIPSVVIGKGYIVSSTRNIPCLVLPCSCPFGNFSVEVAIRRDAAA